MVNRKAMMVRARRMAIIFSDCIYAVYFWFDGRGSSSCFWLYPDLPDLENACGLLRASCAEYDSCSRSRHEKSSQLPVQRIQRRYAFVCCTTMSFALATRRALRSTCPHVSHSQTPARRRVIRSFPIPPFLDPPTLRLRLLDDRGTRTRDSKSPAKRLFAVSPGIDHGTSTSDSKSPA